MLKKWEVPWHLDGCSIIEAENAEEAYHKTYETIEFTPEVIEEATFDVYSCDIMEVEEDTCG